MSWQTSIAVGDFTFSCCDNGPSSNGVVIPPTADLNDPAYVKALGEALTCYPHLRDLMFIREMRYYWYGDSYDRQNITRVDVLEAIERFLLQEDLEIPSWLIKFQHDIKNLLPVLQTDTSYRRKRTPDGYVYLIVSPEGHYKIGKTKNPENRKKTFEVKLPFRVEYVCVIKADDMDTLEKELHARFSDKRINGEWFSLNPEDVAYIQGLVAS